jgi:hypothetical protein
MKVDAGRSWGRAGSKMLVLSVSLRKVIDWANVNPGRLQFGFFKLTLTPQQSD